MLLVGWGSTYGPIRESVDRLRAEGHKAGAMHMRHLHPMPNGLESVFARYDHVVCVEMNDYGVYGYGQLATLLRARYSPSRRSPPSAKPTASPSASAKSSSASRRSSPRTEAERVVDDSRATRMAT